MTRLQKALLQLPEPLRDPALRGYEQFSDKVKDQGYPVDPYAFVAGWGHGCLHGGDLSIVSAFEQYEPQKRGDQP